MKIDNRGMKNIVRLYSEDMELLNTTADELGVSTSRLVRLLLHYISPSFGPLGQSIEFRKWFFRVHSRPLNPSIK